MDCRTCRSCSSLIGGGVSSCATTEFGNRRDLLKGSKAAERAVGWNAWAVATTNERCIFSDSPVWAAEGCRKGVSPTTISLSDSCKATNLTRNPLVSPLASEASAQVDELSDVPIGFATFGRSLFITPPHLCATLSRACAFRTCRLSRKATFLFFYPPTHNQSRVYHPRCDLASEIAISLQLERPAPLPHCLAPPRVNPTNPNPDPQESYKSKSWPSRIQQI